MFRLVQNISLGGSLISLPGDGGGGGGGTSCKGGAAGGPLEDCRLMLEHSLQWAYGRDGEPTSDSVDLQAAH